MGPLAKKYIHDILGELEKLAEWYEKKYNKPLHVKTFATEDRWNVQLEFEVPDGRKFSSGTYIHASRMEDFVYLVRLKTTILKTYQEEIDKKWQRFRN